MLKWVVGFRPNAYLTCFQYVFTDLLMISIDLSKTAHFGYCQSETKSEIIFFLTKFFLTIFFLGFVLDLICLGFWTLSSIFSLKVCLVGENKLTHLEHTKYCKAQVDIFNAWDDYSNGLKTPSQLLKTCTKYVFTPNVDN